MISSSNSKKFVRKRFKQKTMYGYIMVTPDCH